jgi:hypothetical protein
MRSHGVDGQHSATLLKMAAALSLKGNLALQMGNLSLRCLQLLSWRWESGTMEPTGGDVPLSTP